MVVADPDAPEKVPEAPLSLLFLTAIVVLAMSGGVGAIAPGRSMTILSVFHVTIGQHHWRRLALLHNATARGWCSHAGAGPLQRMGLNLPGEGRRTGQDHFRYAEGPLGMLSPIIRSPFRRRRRLVSRASSGR